MFYYYYDWTYILVLIGVVLSLLFRHDGKGCGRKDFASERHL